MTTATPADPRADPPADDATSVQAGVLAAALAKGLIDQTLALAVAGEAARTGRAPTTLLLDRGILTEHIVAALEREVVRARGPRTIGGYRIVEEIGRGGMGVVYRAVQLSVGREVALKVMRASSAAGASSLDGDDYAERFVHEARTAASVNHPQVVTLFDAGRDGDDLYLVMELVVGGDAAHLRQNHGGKLPLQLAVSIVRDAAKGLAAIHRVGLVHRDIKPSNIFISEDGGAKLADLGLSRRADDDAHLTITGAILGTPAYMSPEQAEGLPIDIRSDIYALGATLYALVTGQDPYGGATAMAVAAKAIAGPFPDARLAVPGVEQGVVGIINRCTAHDRDQRFGSPGDLVAACDEVLRELPATAATAPVGPVPASAAPMSALVAPVPASSAKPVRPRGSWTAPVIVGIIAAGAVGGVTWWVVDGMDRDQDRDALLAVISALPDHASPAEESAVGTAVATYDQGADAQRRATIEAAWSQRAQAIGDARAAAAKDLLTLIAGIPLAAPVDDQQAVDRRIAEFSRYADPASLDPVTAAWAARQTAIRSAKSAAFIAALNALTDDDPAATDARLAAFQARIPVLGSEGVATDPLQAALDHRRADLTAARQAAADRIASADKAKAAAETAAAAATDRARQAAARRQTIDDGLATLDASITDAQSALRDASARANRYATADDPQIRDGLHDYYGARRATWDGYVARLTGNADLATVTAAAATIRDRRDADPAAAEAALAPALLLAKHLPDQRAAQRREADDSLVAWCWNRALTGDPTGLNTVPADVPAAAELLAPRIAELKKRLAVLDLPVPVPDHAATAIAVLAQQVPGDADAARWQAKIDEVAQVRQVLAPLDQPCLPTAAQRQAAPRLAALVGGDDAQARRCQDRLARIDAVTAHLARLETWPPPSADDIAALRSDETAWETLTGDIGSATVAAHRALLVAPLVAADLAAVVSVTAGPGPEGPASSAAPAGAVTLRILGRGDAWRVAGYDGSGTLLCWYRLTMHAVGDGWHLVPVMNTPVGGALAAQVAPMAILLPGRTGAGALLWRAQGADVPAVVSSLAVDHLPPFQRGARTVASLVAAAPTPAGRPADGRPGWAADFGNDAYGPWADLTVAAANAPVSQRLRLLPSGTFTMGSPPDEAGRDHDETQHAVTFTKSLWLADSECTQAMWMAVMGSNPSQFRGDPQRPVEQVSWQDSVDFCAALSRRGDLTARLPTESEWEYAARAGGAGSADAAGLAATAWYSGNADGSTHAVRGKHANPWGFYDLLGNVGEWCDDWYGTYPGPAMDPVGSAPPPAADPRHALPPRKCLRGGSWLDGPQGCRAAARAADTPDFSLRSIGFRFAITVP
jgi:formylglycine-generating enzyme required for sulfatase activity/tRNA A-37 threonylcarbamoyl transferase component Bud32